jgi:hypothetical protein
MFSSFFFELKKAFVSFTDEEGYGRYLDLNELFQKYINLKGIEVKRLFIGKKQTKSFNFLSKS